MLRNNITKIILRSLFFSLLLVSESVIGHSGGLNSSGCHGGSKPYHCHRAQSEMVGNRLRCDLGSRSKECVTKSSTNSSISSPKQQSKQKSFVITNDSTQNYAQEQSYKLDKSKLTTKLSNLQIKQIQNKLTLLGIYDGNIDGYFNSDTALALDVYNISKGRQVGDYTLNSVLNLLNIK
jgi:hypothetical protein